MDEIESVHCAARSLGMKLRGRVNTMKTQENTVVSTSVQTFTFDNGSLTFAIDHAVVRAAVAENPSLVDALVGIALKTLIHRSSARPEGNGKDATEWLLDAIEGGEAGGRFRVTSKDKERAANAMKSYKMAPEQAAKMFLDNNGIEYQDDAEWLAKHYMGLRAKAAAEEKAKQNML